MKTEQTSKNIFMYELVIFQQKRKILDHEIKTKLNVKRLYSTSSVKYLGVKIDENLNWHPLF